MILQNKRLIAILSTVAFILLIPLIAMQFTDEVKWSLFDFVVMGVLLLSTGLLCELVMRKFTKLKHRIIIWAFWLIALFLIWAELAVGIFGNSFSPAVNTPTPATKTICSLLKRYAKAFNFRHLIFTVVLFYYRSVNCVFCPWQFHPSLRKDCVSCHTHILHSRISFWRISPSEKCQ